jgi:hypothetical protein
MVGVVFSLKTQFLIFFIVFSINSIRAQEKSWPIHYRTRMDANAPVREGYIVLKSNDTLWGFVKLLSITPSYPILDSKQIGSFKSGDRDISFTPYN